jgi:hypothetical protein
MMMPVKDDAQTNPRLNMKIMPMRNHTQYPNPNAIPKRNLNLKTPTV